MAADGGTNAITQYNGDDGEHLSNLQRLKYARDVSRAIADLHSIDGEDVVTFIHRDIRSSNFLIDFTGRMVVHDFNLSKLVHWNPKTKQQCGFVKPACTEVSAVNCSLLFYIQFIFISFNMSFVCFMYM